MKKISLYLIILIFVSSCGFKVIDMSEQNNFSIANIETTGESKINYIIKNNLLKSTRKDINKINIKLETEKIRSIKEKNIKNEIVEYAVNIKVNVNFKESKNNVDGNFKITNTKGYAVSQKYSETLNSEMRLINVMTQKIANDIIKELSIRANDI